MGEITMRGVVIKKANIISEDNRRRIISILNGEIGVRDIHLLEMKSGEAGVLGNHKHFYPEVCYVYKGSCHYWLKNKEGETMECDLTEGDIMFRAPEVTHTCTCTDDCILIDGASESWIDEDWNHVKEVLVTTNKSEGIKMAEEETTTPVESEETSEESEQETSEETEE